MNIKVIETISNIFSNLTVSRKEETQVTGNGHRVLSWQKNICIHEGLHLGNNLFVWRGSKRKVIINGEKGFSEH